MQHTFRFEVQVKGKWIVSARGVSAVEAKAYRDRYANDPTIRIVTE